MMFLRELIYFIIYEVNYFRATKAATSQHAYERADVWLM